MRGSIQEADQVEILYFTDPLCCWSWALEPQWRRLLSEYGNNISYRYIMGGLLPEWKTYHDPEHSVSKAIQMGPVWMHASHLSGMPMDDKIWIKDPVKSSYPSCIALKCAEHQGAEAADIYLRFLREALMIEGRNIADKMVLLDVAKKLQETVQAFDLQRFENELTSNEGIEAFRKDLLETQSKRIERFPTLLFKYGNQALIMNGYQHYNHLSTIINKLVPNIIKRVLHKPHWLQLTPKEIEEYSSLKD